MSATLDALVLEFLQYGQRPNIGDEAVRRLREVIVAETGGAVNPPLDDLGNNHTFWLAKFIQWLLANGVVVSTAKVYRAIITQTGANPPVSTVLENTLGGTPVWSYDVAGSYILTLAGAFPAGKTLTSIHPETGTAGAPLSFTRGSDDFILLTNGGGDDALQVGVDTWVEILVYP